MASRTSGGGSRRRGNKLVLTVGLVNAPVRLSPLSRDTTVRGTRLCPDHECKTANQIVCADHGHVIDEPLAAFEHDGQYVTGVDRADFKADKDGTLVLVSAVDLSELDPLYFEKSYLLEPDVGGAPAHDLIAAVLRESGRALIGQTVLGTSTRTLAIRYSHATGTLVAHTLVYEAAVAWDNVHDVAQATDSRKVIDGQVALAAQLIDALPAEFDLAEVYDDYSNALLAAIAAAAAGKPIAIKTADPAPEPTQDVMAALLASVAQAKPTPKKPTPKKAAASKTRTRKPAA
jgi:DNA end-binding protein Ku